MEDKVDENKKQNTIDLSFTGNNNLIQTMINLDVFGKPKCKTRRRRFYESKDINR